MGYNVKHTLDFEDFIHTQKNVRYVINYYIGLYIEYFGLSQMYYLN